MSKLSVHISENPTGLDDMLRKCAESNAPISVIYSVNQNIASSIARFSPETRWIYRRQTETFSRLPNAFYQEDPAENARQWLSQTRDPADRQRTQVENWQLNPATWYDPLNEPVIEIADPDNPAQVADAVRKAQWLNTWMITALNIADGLGLKLALFSFPTGSPPLLKWNEVNTSQIQMPPNPECPAVVWHYLLPALRHGKQSGAVLSLHAYWEDRVPSVDRRDALRYRDLMRVLPSDARLPIVVTEASSGNGYDTFLHGQAWIDDMVKWDAELMQDPIILAGCAFQLGVGTESNLAEIMPQYGDYIATHPTPVGLAPRLPDASPDSMMVPSASSTLPSLTSAAAVNMPSFAEPPQPSQAWRGLHMRADGNSTDADFQCITIARLDAAKIMTNTSFEEYARLRLMVQPERIVLRLFAAGDNPSLKDAQRFFNDQFGWLNEFSKHGGRFVEIHNEPNLPDEGFGINGAWQTPDDFGIWFQGVARLIRTAFPALLIGWPGLSPRDNVPQFMPVLDAAIRAGLVDWIGVHCYWSNDTGVDDSENGRHYRRYLGKGKPVIITEFSNNKADDSDQKKGQQYRHYYRTLERGVLGAFSFVSSASDDTFSHKHTETWVRDGAVTAIAHVVSS